MHILLEDYAQCRDEERNWMTILASMFAVAFTLVGLLAAAVTQTCRFSAAKSCVSVPDYLVGAAPLLPIALLAYAQMLGTVTTIRSFYMRGLEEEIQGYTGPPLKTMGKLAPASYISITTELASLRRGKLAYRIFAAMLVMTVLAVFGGLTTYIALHLDPFMQVVMTIVYGPLVLLLAVENYQAGPGGRSMFAKVARDYLAHRDARGFALSDIDLRPQSRTSERSLHSYLLLPRVAELVKWLIVPGAFAVASWAAGSFSHWQRMLLVWLILEYLIYEARYQWNDLRGINDDSAHPVSKARRRLPGGEHIQRNIVASCLSGFIRLAAALVIGAAAHLLIPVAALMGLVFGAGAGYEALRSASAQPRLALRPTVRSSAIWLLVGAGYAIRSGAGIWSAGYSVTSFPALSSMAFFVVFGIMFVLLTWVLEGASYCRTDDGQTLYPLPGLAAKPHVAILLRWTGWQVRTGKGTSPGAEKAVLAMKRAKPYAPWNIGLIVGAVLGGAAATALQPPSPTVDRLIAVLAVCAAGALALIFLTGFLMRLAVTAAIAIALISLAIPFAHGPRALIAAIPWIAIAGDYAFLCNSSYQQLMDFGPQLISTLGAVAHTVPLTLLRVIIGRQSWRSAGFSPSYMQSTTQPSHSTKDPMQPP